MTRWYALCLAGLLVISACTGELDRTALVSLADSASYVLGKNRGLSVVYSRSRFSWQDAAVLDGLRDGLRERSRRTSLSGTDSVSYSSGYQLGTSIASQETRLPGTVPVERAAFFQGFRDAVSDEVWLLSKSQMAAVWREVEARARQVVHDSVAQVNLDATQRDLKARADDSGTVVTPSGLQYRVLRPGSGPLPTLGNRVRVHYRSALLDGTPVQDTYADGAPTVLPVRSRVRGWSEALMLMPVGAKYHVTIPPALGYGDRGVGSRIGPNQALVFEIELIGIEPDHPAASGPVSSGRGGL